MTDDDALDLIRTVLAEVAPEADLATVGPDETIQEALDLDSIDFLNVVEGIHQRTGLDIPERDYPELSTVDRTVRYLATHVTS